MALTNKEAIEEMKQHVQLYPHEYGNGDFSKHTLHLAECWEKLKEYANERTPSGTKQWGYLADKMRRLENPPPPKSLQDQCREALDELYAIVRGGAQLWPSWPSCVEATPILDKINAIKKQLGLSND